LDRSGWNLAFWVKQRKEIQRIRPRVRTQKGFDGKSGGRYRKEDVDSSWPSVLGVWKEKQEVEGRMEDFVGKALGESNTGSLAFRKVLSARFVGWRPMLDLEVRHRAHNFQLASGVITSNSHAVGYSAITTVELWLKFHYPMQFITALLNNTKLGKKKHGSDVLAGYVNYARKRGMKVGLPNVNSSGVGFSTDGKQIWFSVGHVKNVASSSGVVVAGQPYTDMADFFERTTIEVAVKTGKNKGKMRKTKLRKPVVDSLIAAGAFSDFGNRNEVSAEYYALRKKKDEEVPQCSDEGWVKKETEMLGLCLSVPPLLITAADFIRSKNLVTIGEHAEKGKKIWLFGRVADIRPHTSKAGNKMYIVTITDDVDTMNFFVFEGGKEQFRERVRKGFIVAVPMSQFDDSDTRFYDDNRMPEVVEL
jgi:DNA polymerase-3 subunit alpha